MTDKTIQPPLAVPTLAPDFTLTSAEGKSIALSDYRGRQHVVLVINRGFACPFCRRHMAQLRQRYNEFAYRGAEIIVIGPEDPETFARHWRRERFPFVGIPDLDHEVADLYDQEVNLLKLGRMPTVIVIDRHGRIRFQHHGNSMQDIPSDEEILALLDRLNEEERAAVR